MISETTRIHILNLIVYSVVILGLIQCVKMMVKRSKRKFVHTNTANSHTLYPSHFCKTRGRLFLKSLGLQIVNMSRVRNMDTNLRKSVRSTMCRKYIVIKKIKSGKNSAMTIFSYFSTTDCQLWMKSSCIFWKCLTRSLVTLVSNITINFPPHSAR